MCGIAGYVGYQDGQRAETAVRAMMGSLARRGPDGEGLEIRDGACLGHRRLSIFDLSAAGRQPMVSDDGAVSVVFNGAIYNFLELRRELEKSGRRFRSQTDTEILIHGYREWGIRPLLARLRGMFAIGLWDNDRRSLYLLRDRLGVKPLFYVVKNGSIAFASTARALRDAGLAGAIDDQALLEYLEFGYVTDQRSIYQGVRKLPAATLLEWSNSEARTEEYWTPPPAEPRTSQSFEQIVDETEHLFLRAVKLRLEADVPVGALLSGGVDSSLVCWAMSKLGGDMQAFTVGTPGDSWDETADASATAEHLQISHRVIELSPDDSPGPEELVSAYGEPFACASALGMLRISKAIKPYATVLLTGDGGDDVFLGYPEHKNFRMAQQLALRMPVPARALWTGLRVLTPRWGLLRRGSNFLDYATRGLAAVAVAHDGLPGYQRFGILGERIRQATIAQRELEPSLASARNLLPDFLAYDRATRFVGEYMTKVDGGAMHYALEARSPFLDQELWTYASALPLEVRLRGGVLKAVLRELARRHLGERVARGAKRGFGIPVQRWLTGRWKKPFEETFHGSQLAREGYVNESRVRDALQRSAAARGEAPVQLWYLYVLETWLRNERARSNAPGM